jgi:hypothetical protein
LGTGTEPFLKQTPTQAKHDQSVEQASDQTYPGFNKKNDEIKHPGHQRKLLVLIQITPHTCNAQHTMR